MQSEDFTRILHHLEAAKFLINEEDNRTLFAKGAATEIAHVVDKIMKWEEHENALSLIRLEYDSEKTACE